MTIIGTIMALSIPPMPVPVTVCKGWNCLMPMPTDSEANGWQDGYCPECLDEIARQELRDEHNESRYA